MIFDDYQKPQIETHRETIGDILNSMFSVKGQGLLAVIKFVGTLGLFGWTLDSLLPIVQDLGLRMFGFLPAEYELWAKIQEHLSRAVIPVVLFVSLFAFLFFFRRKQLVPISYEVVQSSPHKCLIYMLSTYDDRNTLTLDAMKDGILNESLELDDVLANSNWGNLAFTVAFHGPVLEQCILITTSESQQVYPQAEELILYILANRFGRKVECKEVNIGQDRADANDITKVANTIKDIYRDLEKSEVSVRDVVANITGGTSAMSGAMVLATLKDERSIEYLRQVKPLTENHLRTGDIVLAPRTTFKLAK